MITFGIVLGLVGTDVTSGQTRFDFGVHELADGIGFVPLAVGLFAIAEVILNLQHPERAAARAQMSRLAIGAKQVRLATPATIRGTAVGSLLGLLPGGGAPLRSRPTRWKSGCRVRRRASGRGP